MSFSPTPTPGSRAPSRAATASPAFDGPAGTRYLTKPHVETVKKMPDGTPLLFAEITDSRRIPGYTGHIPGVAAESLSGKTYGHTTKERR